MKHVLNKLFNYESLERDEAQEILSNLASGKYNQSQMAAFLTVYLMRSITVEELEGFRDAMLDLCLKVPADEFDAIDLCGTGGDGRDTFNISTISSFVVAGAGQAVVKHGNYGVSSICGSSNLLEHFGCKFTNDVAAIQKSIDKSGICFLHAPLFHPAMKNVAPIRKELGIKTFFNMLGPMVNPAFPKHQMVGVFSLELARLYGYLYQNTDKHFSIVHSLDGYDEISLTGPFKVITNKREEILHPKDLGFGLLQPHELHGGSTIKDSADIFTSILNNKSSQSQKNVILANAGMAISVGKQKSISEGMAEANESIESGKAMQVFKLFLELNK
ncbi:MAG: anthranilate phosphoribosyltransferase [Saprospiraceae bacterium]|nr:anthranilate phosphoribosyltransferase [Saprospiraceae bacterium]